MLASDYSTLNGGYIFGDLPLILITGDYLKIVIIGGLRAHVPFTV